MTARLAPWHGEDGGLRVSSRVGRRRATRGLRDALRGPKRLAHSARCGGAQALIGATTTLPRRNGLYLGASSTGIAGLRVGLRGDS